MHEVIVIGGGVIGLSIARQFAGRKSVLVLDRAATGEGTSWAAAGMLSPLSEGDDRDPFFKLCRASHDLYRQFIDELEEETGIDCGYSGSGLLSLASSEESAIALRRRYEWQRKAGLAVENISSDEVRKMEPLITAKILTALFMPGESSVVPRELVNALRDSCSKRGVEIRTGVRVHGISKNTVRTDHATFEALSIVIASGVWSAELAGLDPPIPVYPRKGQILSLCMPAGAFRHMIRWQHSYFVPRNTGDLVVGATDEDAGFDRSLTPAGLGKLLADAQAISSEVGSYPILETWTGLRPATPDGLPVIGPSAIPGVFYAAGHYRNGVLLAPITASIIADLVLNGISGVNIEAYAPSRFAGK
ncbi:MAG TPA: glycine oxidase ThiO [Terriglobia bacterium]|nr:glycine oxidase ThiO [Terriglobia bacterium]